MLEPSCGEAAFLLSTVDDNLARLHTKASAQATASALDGVELHPEAAAAEEKVLRRAGSCSLD